MDLYPRCAVDTRTGTARYTPVTSTRSPGLVTSTRSSNVHRVTECGVSPSGMASGVSCMRTCCLSLNVQRLCTSWKLILAAHSGFPHSVGSWMRFRSIVVGSGVYPHREQRKKAALRSGMTFVVRVTMPRMHTSWSMSVGLRSRMFFFWSLCRLNVLICRQRSVSSISATCRSSSAPSTFARSSLCRSFAISCTLKSMRGITSLGYATSWRYSSASYTCKFVQSKLRLRSPLRTISLSSVGYFGCPVMGSSKPWMNLRKRSLVFAMLTLVPQTYVVSTSLLMETSSERAASDVGVRGVRLLIRRVGCTSFRLGVGPTSVGVNGECSGDIVMLLRPAPRAPTPWLLENGEAARLYSELLLLLLFAMRPPDDDAGWLEPGVVRCAPAFPAAAAAAAPPVCAEGSSAMGEDADGAPMAKSSPFEDMVASDGVVM
mmetsp:Transcript_10559/g.23867  ORF Transcript_10559/g.23867 Transcript_10559/m.23867 type:complete len:431 (-) Transcript_10559:2-1294(-)